MADIKTVFFTTLESDLWPTVISKAPQGMTFTVEPLAMDDDRKIELVKDADYILLWPGRLSDRVLRAATKCKLLQLLSAGYNEMNLRLAAELGIPVANNGGANSVAVAEHTIMLILACYRRMMFYSNNAKGGRWRPNIQDRKIDLFELEGKTLGTIGIGNIARQVVKRARAFGAVLQYYDRYHSLPPTQEQALDIKGVSLEELLRTSDVVSVHVPLTRETRGMIGAAELAMMKPTSIIVNTSRGGIIAEEALVEALRSGSIAGAGLDVLEHEPPDPDDPLLKLETVTVTPHIAGPTVESIPKRATNAFANVQRVCDGQAPLWTVEFESPD